MTASYVRARRAEDDSIPTCSYFEQYDIEGREFVLPAGVHNLDDVKEFGSFGIFCRWNFRWIEIMEFAGTIL